MPPAHEAGPYDELRLSDVNTFLDVYLKSKEISADSFNKLFSGLGQPATSVIGKLERITAFLFTGAQDLAPKGKGPGFEALFEMTPAHGLKPTRTGEQLYKNFKDLKSLSQQARTHFQDSLAQGRHIVHLGAPQTIANRLFACAYSDLKFFERNNLELHVEVDTSVELIRRLSSSSAIAAVVAYGRAERANQLALPPAPRFEEQLALLEPGLDVCFRSFGFTFSMTLLCHPEQPLLAKAPHGRPRKDLTPEGYYNRLKEERQRREETWKKHKEGPKPGRKGHQGPSLYQELHEVKPADIDFSALPLIVVPSYAQPPALQLIIDEAWQRAGVREAHSYDEALALVRAGQGLAFASEVFCARSGVNAFRLGPAEDYQRSVGAYYNTRHGLSEQALPLLRFLCTYMHEFGERIRVTGDPPAYGDKDFENFCGAYAKADADGRGRQPKDWPKDWPKGWRSVEEFPKYSATSGEGPAEPQPQAERDAPVV